MPSKEVNAVGEGPASAKQLEERAAALRQIVDQPSERERAAQELADLERQLAEAREAKANAAAKTRRVGIRRAHGSKRAERDRLLQEQLRLAKAYAENSAQVRAVDDDLALYEMEDAALADRFDLARSDLPRLIPSGATPEALQAHRIVDKASLPEHRFSVRPTTELSEHAMNQRRTYMEVADTEGYRIITSAGLKAWPPLTERQRAIIAERARDEERMRRQLQSLPSVANVPPNLSLGSI